MDGLIRQGDILFKPIPRTTPATSKWDLMTLDAQTVKRQGGDVIVAAGEATGHHHRIATKKVVMYRDGTRTYLKVPKGGANLTHEEHEKLFIPEGWYEIENQREYVPQAAPVRVYD